MEKSKNFIEQTIINEIAGKNSAIHAYDKIIWQIRTGLLTLVFGGWAFILKGAIETGKPISDIKEYIYIMILLSFILSFGGYMVERNYVRRKFLVVSALTKLQQLLVEGTINFDKLSEESINKIQPLIGVVGDSGSNDYKNSGFKKEINVSNLIYSVTIIGCICLAIYVFVNSK